jgi:DNA polymerase I-like protein with 3'-5' exonuclease and polymerase domains
VGLGVGAARGNHRSTSKLIELPELKPVIVAEMNPPLNTLRITDMTGMAKLQDFFDRVKAAGGVIGWDIETTPLKDFFYRRVRTIQFGNLTEQYVIDLREFCRPDLAVCAVSADGGNSAADVLFHAQGGYGKHITPRLAEVLAILKPVVCTNDFLKVGVNLGFEYLNFYWNLGLRTWHFWDCAMVEKCIYAGAMPLKRYVLFSMEEMMARYFQLKIDKQYQESFALDNDLNDDQIAYAALDTRFPIAIRQVQMLILAGHTYKRLAAAGKPAAKYLKYIDPLVTGDNLMEIAQVENNAIGAFEDMHVHGERMDRPRWLARVQKAKDSFQKLLDEELDPIFLPIVGSKLDIITDEQIAAARDAWKIYADPTPEMKALLRVSDEEMEITKQIRLAEKSGNIAALEQLTAMKEKVKEDRKAKAAELKAERDEKKEFLKKEASELGKRRTRIKKLIEKCEGQALINYGSDKQLLKIVNGMKGLSTLKGLDDDTLVKFTKYPVIAAIKKYHGLSKEIGTYGDAWATEFVTKPCKEEGWLNPGDGRLHCVFNQYDAETGRSSSEKPNGQNLPQDKEVRGCFIADDPDESIRVSDCCESAVTHIFSGEEICDACGKWCTHHAEEYMYITCDMSGAELRIIAELADDPVWIGAFTRGEDVHSVCTELLYPEKWPELALPDCAYYKLREDGTPQHKKCKCPEHNTLRDGTKAVNFLLCYGGGPTTLAARIGVKREKAQELLDIHAERFPRIWTYLEESGKKAKIHKKSFDMFGRRRIFPEPTMERAREYCIEDRAERLELDTDQQTDNIVAFNEKNGRKPDKEELFWLTHREPSNREVMSSMMGLAESIGRQGKNHPIQSANATLAKLAMGCGFDKDGIPFLWHALPKLRAKLVKFVHDELVIQAPKHLAQKVADEIQSAFKRAAAMRMEKVAMESEYHIEFFWSK